MIDLVTLLGTSLPRVAARLFPDITFRFDTAERVAYLTFDDGPHAEITPGLIEILDRFEAGATFFLLGAHARRHPRMVQDLVMGGHTVGNHTYSHPDAWRVDTDRVVRELEDATMAIEDAGGTKVSWMRPPYGRFTRGMRAWCRESGQRMMMWDVGTGDFLAHVSQDHVVRHVESYIRPGSIIVLHDNPCCADTTPAALETLLVRMTEEGWRFDSLPA